MQRHEALLLSLLVERLRLPAQSRQVERVRVVIVGVRVVVVGPLAALKQGAASVVLGLAGLLLGGLFVDAVLFPLGKRLGRDGREGAGELVAFGLEEVF